MEFESELRCEFLKEVIDGVIERINHSSANKIIEEEARRNFLSRACDIRNKFDDMAEDELERAIKDIVTSCGVKKFNHILKLYHGNDYLDAFDEQYHDFISLYNDTFEPLAFLTKEDSIDISDIIPPFIKPVRLKMGGDVTSNQFTECAMIFSSPSAMMLGHFVQETCHYYIDNYSCLIEKYDEIYDRIKVPKKFKENYIKNICLRDFVLNSDEDLILQVSSAYDGYKKMKKDTDENIINKFKNLTTPERREYFSILLLQDIKQACLLEFRKECSAHEYNNIKQSLSLGLQETLEEYCGSLKRKRIVTKYDKEPISSKTLKDRVLDSGANYEAMEKAMEKVRQLDKEPRGTTDAKIEKYLNGFLKIPFGKYHDHYVSEYKKSLFDMSNELYEKVKENLSENLSNKINSVNDLNFESIVEALIKETSKTEKKLSKKVNSNLRKYKKSRKEVITKSRKILDEAIHGHEEAKLNIERIISQWMSGKQTSTILGICGPPGNGKTTLIKDGLAKCLANKTGKNHPFQIISLGGLAHGSTLIGHSYTYVGSQWGKVFAAVQKAGVCNPIILFDELDKVARTEHAQEIISILTCLCDESTNNKFVDEYFQFPIDLSRAMIIFTFNDASRIDRVLLDRIKVIYTKSLRLTEKQKIAKDYLIPRLSPDIGFHKSDITIDDSIVRMIIEDYTQEGGVRKLKQMLCDVLREANRKRAQGKLKLPCSLSKKFVTEVLKRKYKIIHDVIHKKPHVGIINGMYANSTGLGGITPIQVRKVKSKEHLKLVLTGSQGKVMKESMECAKTNALSMMTEEEAKILNDKDDMFSIHIHCPDTSTEKDGPSAGGAITLAILSLLTNRPINNQMAITGEIDLEGNLKEIGGLDEKLLGVKKAGVKVAFIPRENKQSLDLIKKDNLLTFDENFQVIMVDHITDVIKTNLVFV